MRAEFIKCLGCGRKYDEPSFMPFCYDCASKDESMEDKLRNGVAPGHEREVMLAAAEHIKRLSDLLRGMTQGARRFEYKGKTYQLLGEAEVKKGDDYVPIREGDSIAVYMTSHFEVFARHKSEFEAKFREIGNEGPDEKAERYRRPLD